MVLKFKIINQMMQYILVQLKVLKYYLVEKILMLLIIQKIEVSSGIGTIAKIQPVISGKFEKVYVDSQDYNIDKIVSN